jgi:hypothetical protein
VKRRFSLASLILIAFAAGPGIVVFLSYLMPDLNSVQGALIELAIIMGTIVLLFGGGINVLAVHLNKIRHRQAGWVYSLFVWLGCGIMAFAALSSGGPDSELVSLLFRHVQFPLQATLFSLLAFFVATAAYRAFRLRSLESVAFLLIAAIVLLGQIPGWASDSLRETLPWLREWTLTKVALGGARGILLGVALGTIVVGIRLLIGIDRPYAD